MLVLFHYIPDRSPVVTLLQGFSHLLQRLLSEKKVLWE